MNQRPPPCEDGALPLSYAPALMCGSARFTVVAVAMSSRSVAKLAQGIRDLIEMFN